jgi:hypothetical protein
MKGCVVLVGKTLPLGNTTTAATDAADEMPLIDCVTALARLLPLLYPAIGTDMPTGPCADQTTCAPRSLSTTRSSDAGNLEQTLVPGPGWRDVSRLLHAHVKLAEAHETGTTVRDPRPTAQHHRPRPGLPPQQRRYFCHRSPRFETGGPGASAREPTRAASSPCPPSPADASSSSAPTAQPSPSPLSDEQAKLPTSSTAQALIDPPTVHTYGGSGIEAEYTFPMSVDSPEDANALYQRELAYGPEGAVLVVESKDFFRGRHGRLYRTLEGAVAGGGQGEVVGMVIPELIVGVMATVAGEEWRIDPDRAFTAYQNAERAFESIQGAPGSAPSIPLTSILKPEDGWWFSELGNTARIGPRPIGDFPGAHVHHNIGVPLAVVYPFLAHVRDHTWRDESRGYLTRAHLSDALEFGAAIGDRFIQWAATRGESAPDWYAVESVRGATALLYVQGAMFASLYMISTLEKAHAAVLPRHDPADVLAHLPDAARAFLSADARDIIKSFEKHLRARIPDYDEQLLRPLDLPLDEYVELLELPIEITDGPDEIQLKDFLLTGLADGHLPRIELNDTIRVTTLGDLDDNGGATVPLLVLEVRSYGSRHVQAPAMQADHERLMTFVRERYQHSQAMHPPRQPGQRVTGAGPVRLPMSDGFLAQLVQGMRGWLGADRKEIGAEGELPASDCVALLAAFTKALHPGDARLLSRLGGDLHGGVVPSRTVDDSVIGTGRDNARLARGAYWTRADSWETVAGKVEAAGPGATALILWQRQHDTGHAFGAHRTTAGVRWLEIGAANGRHVLKSAPVYAAAHARYVVIDAMGRIVDDEVRAVRESESTARAIIDAPLRNTYGKMGPEFETYWLLTSPQELFHGYRLFGDRYVEMVAERLRRDAPNSLEFVGGPINQPGEVGGISEDGFWRSFEYAFHRLQQLTPLPMLFGRTDDFQALDYPHTSLGTVEPGKELALSPQWTVGMPASEILDWLLKDVRRMSVQSTGTAHADAEIGAALGKLVAARYFAAQHGMELRNPHLAWELLDDSDYRSVGGLIALVFMQAVTAAHAVDDTASGKPRQPWLKNYTFAALRHDPALLSRALSPAARDFLDRNADAVMADFSSHALLTLHSGYGRDPMDAPFHDWEFTARDYVNSFLRIRPGRTVAPHGLGVHTTFDRLDGDKVLVELRDLADVRDVPEAREQYDMLKAPVRARYARAQLRPALSEEHHAAQRSLLAAIGEDQMVGALEWALSLTSRLNALHPEKARGFELLDRAALPDLVGAVVALAAPRQMARSQPSQRVAAARALERLGERLVDFGGTLNLFGDPAWDRIKQDWDQGMRDVASLRNALGGELASWPPRDVTGEWQRFSALPGLAPRRSLKGVDDAVRNVVARPGDETALHAVLDQISRWRDVHARPDSSAARRAPAVRHLERLILHKLAAVAELPPYPVPGPGAVARWSERFEFAHEFLRNLDQPDRAALISQASTIVAEYHVEPPHARDGRPSAQGAAYQETHSNVVYLVASLLGRDRSLSNPERRARQVAVETARDLGTALPTSEGAGTRQTDSSRLHNATSTAGDSGARSRWRGALPGTGHITANMADTDAAMMNGLHNALAEAIETGNERAAEGLRSALNSRRGAGAGTGFDELAELGRRRRQAQPQTASRPPGGTVRNAGPHVDIDPKSGIGWASSQYSARDIDGGLIPQGQRSCVEVTVIPDWAADGPAWGQDALPPAD